MRRRWRELRARGLRDALLATTDRHAKLLREPARRNFARWPVLRSGVFPGQEPRGSYRAEVRATRRWLDRRIAQLDRALVLRPRLEH
jgi:cob(I)alamin adenosyltransferase